VYILGVCERFALEPLDVVFKVEVVVGRFSPGFVLRFHWFKQQLSFLLSRHHLVGLGSGPFVLKIGELAKMDELLSIFAAKGSPGRFETQKPGP
jgi:hypothetical protein